jgi:hypothetical protein
VSWHPNDLVSDIDLRDYEASILERFGQTSWLAKRTKALEDWLFPVLKGQGFNPHRLRTRRECQSVQGYTASTYSDLTSAASSTTEDDVALATVFATAGSDALYLGLDEPYKGLFFRLLDTVGSAASVLSVAYWNGQWEALQISDGTAKTAGKTFSGGGSVHWLLPMDWAVRKVNSVGPYYWTKVTVSATPTSATATQIGAIRGSVLRAPATFRTLELIFREAPTGAPGPWDEKADYYEKQADSALQRALAIAGGDFETDDPPTDLISEDESGQTTAEVAGGWKLERA